jgi:uncharacterized protein YjiS (DUF1127 family)
MREYVLQQSQTRMAIDNFSMVTRMVKNWRFRGALRQLARLDDHALRDIGLSRAELDRLARLPLTSDMLWEAERSRLLASRRSPDA